MANGHASTIATSDRALVGWTAVAVAGVVAALIVPLLPVLTEGGTLQPVFDHSTTPVPQRAPARTWRPFLWTQVGHVGAADGLRRAGFLRMTADGRLSVLDGDDYSIKTVEFPGKLVGSHAIPKVALRESLTPLTGLAVAPSDGMVWLCNPNGRLVGLGPGQDRAVVRAGAYKVEAVGDRLVVMERAGSPYMFALHDRSGALIARFGSLLAEQERHGIALDGDMAVDFSNGSIFFVPYYGGFLASYDGHGRLRFIVASISTAPLPKLTRIKGGGIKVPKLSAQSVFMTDVAISGDAFYVLMHVPGQQGGRESIVDIYRPSDGTYQGSIRLPLMCAALAVNGDALYGACGDGVTVWRRSATPHADTSSSS